MASISRIYSSHVSVTWDMARTAIEKKYKALMGIYNMDERLKRQTEVGNVIQK